MVEERYSANVCALGAQIVKKLNSECVAVRGSGPIAQSTIYNLLGLGVRSIEHITDSDKLSNGILRKLANAISPNPSSFETSLFFIAPYVNYKRTSKPKSASVLLDTGGGGSSRVPPYAISPQTISICDIRDSHANKLFNSEIYDSHYALFAGALLADEVRKRAGHSSVHEEQLAKGDAIQLALPKLLHPHAIKLVPAQLNRVLVVGAGGLGTYCTYLLAERKVREIVLYDPDEIDETNLNRQLFYTGRVGESKVDVLSERLSNKNSKVIPRAEYFTSGSKNCKNLDAIFCCTDTYESRIAISDYAFSRKIPLIEGACTPTMGCVTTYVPDKTMTICEQRNLYDLVKIKNDNSKFIRSDEISSSCARVVNPSIIGPNVIVGGLQAMALDVKYDSVGNRVDAYPQVFVNLLRNSKFSHGRA